MPFKGTLQNNERLTIEVSPNISNNGPTALTIFYLNETGKIPDIDILSVPLLNPLGVPVLDRVIPRNTTRVLIDVENPPGNDAAVRMSQTMVIIAEVANGDIRYSFDVV